MTFDFAFMVFSSALVLSAAISQASTPPEPEVSVPIFNNENCPIMGKPVSTSQFTDTEMGRFYVCCKKCFTKIHADVSKAHRTAYPVVTKAENSTCPVTGEKIEKNSPSVTVQGYEIAICCEDCIQEVRTNTQIALAKATDPKVIDIGNKICPITEKPVAKNAFVLIGKELVHLSSPDCVEAVMKEPKKTLAKAKEIVAKEGKKEEPKKEGGDRGGR